MGLYRLGLVFLMVFLTVCPGLLSILNGYAGYFTIPQIKVENFLIGGTIILLIMLLFKRDWIKKHTEKEYKVKLDYDVRYTEKFLHSARLIHPLEEEPSLLQRYEEEFGIKINPKKYTIVLSSIDTLRQEAPRWYRKWKECEERDKLYGRSRLAEESRVNKELCKLMYQHPEMINFAQKCHEIGHILGAHFGLQEGTRDEEGLAMLYGWKGLLLAVKKGKFGIDEARKCMKLDVDVWKTFGGFGYGEAYEHFLKDINLDFQSVDVVLEHINKKINYILHAAGKKLKNKWRDIVKKDI